MTITPAAKAALSDLVRRSDVRRPVIHFVLGSDTPIVLVEAIKRGAGRRELRDLARSVLPKQRKYLHPVVWPSSRSLWLSSSIDGFRFAPLFAQLPRAREAFRTGSLDVAERGMVLRDANGVVVLPEEPKGAL